MNRWKINTVLCDIDATITDVLPGCSQAEFRDAVFRIFARRIARRRGIGPDKAMSMLNDFADRLMVWWDYPDFIVNFELEPQEIWREMREIHQTMLHVYDDAADMIRELHGMGKNLYIVSNNPVTGCLLKLERAELAGLFGSPYFKRIFGTNVVHGMKSQPAMWKQVAANLGIPGEDMLVIGDSVREDCEIPRQAGIGNAIIVDRRREAAVTEEPGCICVNSLARVKGLIY